MTSFKQHNRLNWQKNIFIFGILLIISIYSSARLYQEFKILFFSQINMEVVSDSTREDKALTFRGAMIDGVWYNPEELIQQGEWNAVDLGKVKFSESLIINIPAARQINLAFDAGPEQGSVRIIYDGETYFCDLYRDNEQVEYGGGIEIEGSSKGIILSLVCSIAVGICILCGGYGALIWINKKKNAINIKRAEPVILGFLFPTAFIILYLFSLSSTPRVPEEVNFWGYDAAIFNVVGRAWGEGIVPFKEIFDHKGPIIFFIYMIGNCISQRYGIFLLQSIFGGITLCMSYLIGKEVSGFKGGLISVGCSIIYFLMVIDEGALSEEFNLPFLMISTWLIIRYLNVATQKVDHPPIYALIHGMTCAISLYIRATNCISICCYGLCIAIYLIYKKRKINFLKNLGTFLAGVIVVIAPFAIYFALHHALQDMIYGTLTFNILYAKDSAAHSLNDWFKIFIYLIPVLLTMLTSFGRKGLARNATVFSCIGTAWMMAHSELYPHYYVIVLPFVAIAVGTVINLNFSINKKSISWAFRCGIIVLLTLSCKLSFENAIAKYNWISSLRATGENQNAILIRDQCDAIPLDERDAVAGYNVDASWYLITDIIPQNRLFILQNQRYLIDNTLLQEDIQLYESEQIRWIILKEGPIYKEIEDIINERYEMKDRIWVESDGGYYLALYQRK